jgi:hypothetical protein
MLSTLFAVGFKVVKKNVLYCFSTIGFAEARAVRKRDAKA